MDALPIIRSVSLLPYNVLHLIERYDTRPRWAYIVGRSIVPDVDRMSMDDVRFFCRTGRSLRAMYVDGYLVKSTFYYDPDNMWLYGQYYDIIDNEHVLVSWYYNFIFFEYT
jgi:hypothetical protein